MLEYSASIWNRRTHICYCSRFFFIETGNGKRDTHSGHNIRLASARFPTEPRTSHETSAPFESLIGSNLISLSPFSVRPTLFRTIFDQLVPSRVSSSFSRQLIYSFILSRSVRSTRGLSSLHLALSACLNRTLIAMLPVHGGDMVRRSIIGVKNNHE